MEPMKGRAGTKGSKVRHSTRSDPNLFTADAAVAFFARRPFPALCSGGVGGSFGVGVVEMVLTIEDIINGEEEAYGGSDRLKTATG